MTTGDLRNNLRKLQSELKAINYTRDVDFESLGTGNTADFLPIYHYVFIDYSRLLSAKIVEMNVEMFGKTDLRFIEAVYKVLSDMFTYKPPVTKLQFFAPGFGERKVIMCTQVLQLMRVKHQSLLQSTKGASGKRRPGQPSAAPISSTHLVPAASGEIFPKALLHTTLKPDRQATGDSTAGVVPLVVNEVRSRTVSSANCETAVGREWADVVLPPVAYSINEDRQRQSEDAIKNTLLEAFSKINDSVEQISSRLGTLDHRLARLESLEQQLIKFNRLESRIGDAEETVSRKLPVETGLELQDSNNMTLITSQLNNLVARMTLVENKLVMLQSAEVPAAARGSNTTNRLPNISSASSDSIKHNIDSDDLKNHRFDVQVSATDADVVVVSDSHAVTSGPIEHEQDAKSTRSEQLSRIEAMLRGTEELLTGSSLRASQSNSPVFT